NAERFWSFTSASRVVADVVLQAVAHGVDLLLGPQRRRRRLVDLVLDRVAGVGGQLGHQVGDLHDAAVDAPQAADQPGGREQARAPSQDGQHRGQGHVNSYSRTWMLAFHQAPSRAIFSPV